MSELANKFWHTRVTRAAAELVALTLATACTGVVAGTTRDGQGNPAPGPGAGASSSVANAIVDPGRVGIHRLNNTEYDNTVHDLFGTASQPAAGFLAEDGLSFDNTASALGMTSPQYQGYFDTASTLLTEVLASPAERAHFMSCTPVVADDPCAKQIITNFGLQIYRRPLETAEVERAMKVYNADIARAQPGTEAIGQALRAMISAANFLYRVEYDADPNSISPHALSGYELASRLSYMHWSSMPDAALFDAAKSGSLATPAALEATVERLLSDPKANAFVHSFAGQWLGIRKLDTHSVTAAVFPTYTSALSDAMMAEGYAWFQEFLSQDRPLTDWFTADFNYVNDTLATHYGIPLPGSADKLVRVAVTNDQRQGFLGLASFLTVTSVPSRTSPTTRGAWVMTALLCSPPPPPPGNVPQLDDTTTMNATAEPPATENVRARLEAHRANPTCAGCHALLDPIGLGLERYDGIGRYRDKYGNGDAIDPAGMLPDGTAFSGPQQLGALIGKDPRFNACVASKMYTYALGREIEGYDATEMQILAQRWAARGLTFKNLMKEVVLADAFRLRHGEAP